VDGTAPLPGGLLPLWPFQTAAQVHAWQAHRLALGGDPQHRLDPAATALEFTRGALGLTGVDRVLASRPRDGGRHVVEVGRGSGEGAGTAVARVCLARWGPDPDAPWVVTGTLDAAAVTVPAYGAVVTSPVTVAGTAGGTDEALRVRVIAPGGATVGAAGPVTLGGADQPWSVVVDLTPAPSGALLAVTVSTGGHVADVEWFAVTAVRLG